MRQVANLLATDLSLGELFDRLTKMLPEHLDSSVVFIALARPDDQHSIEYFYDHGEIKRYPHIVLGPHSRARAVIGTGEMIWGNDPSVWAPQGSEPIHKDRPWTNDTVSAIFVPMKAGGSTVGCLSVQSTRAGAYTTDEVELVAAIGHYVGVAVENQRMYQTLQRTAEYDVQTGLASYSKFARELDETVASATSLRPATVIVLDIVNFSAFNEVYGYSEGDEVLRLVGDVLHDCEDGNVVCARYGDDVFMVLVKESSPDEVDPFVARLDKRLRALAYVSRDQTIPVSVAIGYALAPLDGGTRYSLISRCVDRARLSRREGCRPIRVDDPSASPLAGTFSGIETIVSALLDRDPYTRVHLFEVNAMAKLWSQHNLELDRDALAMFLQASLLHDVGKLLVSDRILVKPGRLSTEEYESAKRHAIYGRNVLALQPGWDEVAAIVGQHHEWWNGRGYPEGLAGEAIHPLARAVAVLDAYSAMVSDRPYHRGVTEAAALAELQRCAGTQFDPYYVERFVAWREALTETR
ncbi:MAG: diguanylate cyclase [Candidatus Eremiobacteraeota bacterium]|nr:diguanylate cyclase [Candidatus Eremiobacteraeota bacterium]MBV8284298.1 diguanylate cyclase [Candidatus Eremiobacteraeota bacterium]